MSPTNLRREYAMTSLDVTDVDPDPLVQFRRWFAEAQQASLLEPNAMTLATATRDGRPSARVVLLKILDERGFGFFTDYRSRKAAELESNPYASLSFSWLELERCTQTRTSGGSSETDAKDVAVSAAIDGASHAAVNRAVSIVVPSSTSNGNFTVTDNLRVTPADYDPFCITAPRDPRLPNGGGYQVCDLGDVTPAKFGLVDTVVTPASRFGEQSRTYHGVDGTLSARFGTGGMLAGGVSTGRTVTDICDIVARVPEFAVNLATNVALTSNHENGPTNAPSRVCRVSPPWSALTQIKLSGTYALPWDLRASFNYQNLPGIATLATHVVPGAQITAALGRAPAAGARATATVDLIEPKSVYREGRLNQVNLALSRVFTAGRSTIQPRLELHNALNASTIHTMVTRYGPAWEQVRGVLAPRLIKIAAQVDF